MFKKINLLILGLTILFISCSKRDDSVFGPEYLAAPSNLKVSGDSLVIIRVGDKTETDLGATSITFYNPNDVDSVYNPVYFKAQLSDSVTWKVTIKGLESDAQKTLVGTGKSIRNAFWGGESENINFFKRGESLSITLSFIGIETNVKRIVQFADPKLFPGVYLVSDFELGEEGQGIVKGAAPPGDADGWFDYFDIEGENETISKGVGPNNIDVVQPSKASTPVKPIQGDGYYHLRGDDNSVKPSPFFIGGMGHDAVVYGLPSLDPANVFLNFYATSNGNTTTKLIVELAGFGGDLLTKDIQVDWKGWKLVSIRLSDFALTTSGDIGQGVILTPLLEQMKFAIHSGKGNAGSTAEINIDYITFTVGKPFRQQ